MTLSAGWEHTYPRLVRLPPDVDVRMSSNKLLHPCAKKDYKKTKWNDTKRNETKRNERNETKRTRRNETKRNETTRNETKEGFLAVRMALPNTFLKVFLPSEWPYRTQFWRFDRSNVRTFDPPSVAIPWQHWCTWDTVCGEKKGNKRFFKYFFKKVFECFWISF